jgi:nucleoside-diphosphate-sugar epimerase
LPALRQAGWDVHAVARHAPEHDDGAHWHMADLLNQGECREVIGAAQPTHLLHLAWTATVPGAFWAAEENYAWVQASLNLFQAFAAQGGQRLVVAGTCAEYDWDFGYCSEAVTPLRPASVYGACKHALHLMLEKWSAQQGIGFAWGRVFFLYGPHEHPQKLVASVCRDLIHQRTAHCSSGGQVRDYLHIHDAATALSNLIDSDAQGAVNIASGVPVAVREIVSLLGEIEGRSDLLAFGKRESSHEPPFIVGDTRRLRQELLWSPEFDLESGLRQTLEWWRKSIMGDGYHEINH